MREFVRQYLFKTLLVLIIVEIGVFAYLQKRNHRPVAVNDKTELYAGHSKEIAPLKNDIDKNEDELILFSFTQPVMGKVDSLNNRLTYSPNSGFHGLDSFAYTISDRKKESHKAYIIVDVKENLPPQTNSDLIESYPMSEIAMNVLGNDTDREGDSIFITDFTQPKNGEVKKRNGDLIYTTNSNKAEVDSFKYKLSDGFSESEYTSAVVRIKSKSDPLYPWLSNDFGGPAIAGSFKKVGHEYVMTASGADIWNEADNFRYTYQPFSGNGEIITQVKSIGNTQPWAKSGVMFRESLRPESKYAFAMLTAENGTTFQVRPETAERSSTPGRIPEKEAPTWLKLVRKNDIFTGYQSDDGKNWNLIASDSVHMVKNIYVGFALTSHNDDTLCVTRFNVNETIIRRR